MLLIIYPIESHVNYMRMVQPSLALRRGPGIIYTVDTCTLTSVKGLGKRLGPTTHALPHMLR